MDDGAPTETTGLPDQAGSASGAVAGQAPRTQKVGRVVSDKMEKTVVVTVDSVRRHPLYHKRMTRTSRFLVHDEQNRCKPGDLVRIEETRPMSKRKRWIVREVLQQGVRI